MTGQLNPSTYPPTPSQQAPSDHISRPSSRPSSRPTPPRQPPPARSTIGPTARCRAWGPLARTRIGTRSSTSPGTEAAAGLPLRRAPWPRRHHRRPAARRPSRSLAPAPISTSRYRGRKMEVADERRTRTKESAAHFFVYQHPHSCRPDSTTRSRSSSSTRSGNSSNNIGNSRRRRRRRRSSSARRPAGRRRSASSPRPSRAPAFSCWWKRSRPRSRSCPVRVRMNASRLVLLLPRLCSGAALLVLTKKGLTQPNTTTP